MNALNVYEPPSRDEWQMLQHQADVLAKSAIVPQSFRGKPADIIVATLTARELGIGPMAALNHIAVINGKATLSAEGMVALVRSRGHSISGTSSDTEAEVVGTRADNGDTLTVKFTMQDATRANLLKNAVWKQYPSDMLWARAVSKLCRRLFSDVISGLSYTAEEAESFTSTDTHDAPVATVTVLPNDNDAQEAAETLQEAVEDRDAEFARLRTKFMAQIGDLGFAYAVDVKPWLLETYEVESFNDLGLEEVRALTSALDKDSKRAGFSKRITDFRLANAPDDDVEDAEVVEEDGEESIKARVERLGLKKVDVIAKANELAVGLKATKPTAYMKDWREGGMHPGLFAAIVSWLDEVEEGAK